MSRSFDVVIIGGGGIGSSAAWHHARTGQRTLVLEQFSEGHRSGSSHGETRAIRKAYFEHPDYVPLLERAYELWRELEALTGESLFQRCGLLLSGPEESEVIQGARLSAATHQIPLMDMTAEARVHFPCFRFPQDHSVVFEPEAGFLHVERCVDAHLRAARSAGATTLFDQRVVSWSASDRGVTVSTESEQFECEVLILAGGAWNSGLLKCEIPLQILRKTQFWYPISQLRNASATQSVPVFLFQMPDGVFYGFPSIDGCTMKIAEHSGGTEVETPEALDRSVSNSDCQPLNSFARRVLPVLGSAPKRGSVCMYTMTPDHHFVIDQHPEHSNVLLAAGFSGHGFKFASVIGEVLCGMSTGTDAGRSASFLKLRGRF